ncbi:MAG: hypothetical protein U0521_26140 [Anaerolineae bacterium]
MRRSSAFRQIYYVGGNERHGCPASTSRWSRSASTPYRAFWRRSRACCPSPLTVGDPAPALAKSCASSPPASSAGAACRRKGTVIGGLFGLIFVGFINNGLILLRVPVYWQQLSMECRAAAGGGVRYPESALAIAFARQEIRLTCAGIFR